MNDPRGSLWRKWDLHFHTPKSTNCYRNKGITASEIAGALIQADVAVVAVTDHHVLDAKFIEQIQGAGKGRLTVLPGIELSSNLGGDESVHFIGIFPECSDLAYLSNELMVKLDLSQKRNDGVPEEKLYVNFPSAAKVIQDLGGLITIHGHGKAANFETITSRLKFKQQQKTDLLRDYVDIIEVGSRADADPYLNKIFPAINLSLPLITCSDNHDSKRYSVPAPCWIKADPTFAGLKMALRRPQYRIWLGDKPDAIDRLSRNKTRYLKSIAFAREPQMPAGEQWLEGEVPLNPGLIAIIGNKGGGKSALADCLGLLGSCSTSESFSFLNSERFRNPKTGRAQYVRGTLQWHDGAPRVRLLSDGIGVDEPERVKFLPQNYVEKVCNDLATSDGGEFERELKKVIFSKVPTADRLGHRSLDDFVEFQTQELRKAADSLALSLADLAIHRANLEERLDPAVRSAIEKQISQRSEEIKSHESNKPTPVAPPPDGAGAVPGTGSHVELLRQLGVERTATSSQIQEAEVAIAKEQIRAATAQKLLDKLENLRADVSRQVAEMKAEAQALGVDVSTLVTVTWDTTAVELVRNDALTKRKAASDLIEGPAPDGLRQKAEALENQIRLTQALLDRPNQEYQEYLQRLSAWQATLDTLVGKTTEPDSLKGMEGDLAALAGVPAEIAAIEQQQEVIAAEIHKLRTKEVTVYRDLYRPVQDFIENHRLAKDHLKLDFKVELTQDCIVDVLLGHINQQRKGTFYGLDDGRAAAQSLVSVVNWGDWQDVLDFLRNLVWSLHTDMRPGFPAIPVLLKNQIGKGKTGADLYAWLYGLRYIRPRYFLRWEDKDVGQLSPGERGTLLLIFYLLIDDSDVPLIIDQPEANLDNLTVSQKLVECIRRACDRRQVVIVTHNPNLAVVCDADQLIHASLDKRHGNKITYQTGALEHPEMNRFAIDVLEGSRGPFDLRDQAYSVMGQ